MKSKLIIIACFAFLSINLIAQTSTSISVELKWRGIERRYATDSIFTDVLTFDGAQHIGDDALPHYHYSFSADDAFSYTPELKNPVYVELNDDELKFLRNTHFANAPKTESYTSNSRGEKAFLISILPFVEQDNQTLKLKSFDLVIEKSPQQKRSAQASTIHSYVDKSVLSQGRFVKVRITESGIYKLTYSELKNKGINPANVRMFGYGGAALPEDFSLAKHDDLPEIAIYDTGDAILFYAQGINKWTYNSSSDMFIHQLNPYSVYGYYFVTSDNVGEKKRIQQKNEIIVPETAILNDVTEFTDYKVHEKEQNHVIKSGRELYGEKFTNGASTSLSFSFPNILQTTSLKARIEVVKSASSSSVFSLKLNNSQKNITLNSLSTTVIHAFSPTSDDLNFNLSYNGTATGYLNYLEINAQRNLKMANSAMLIHNKQNLSANSYNRYLLETDNSKIQIWDINDQTNVQQMATTRENGKLIFTDSASAAKSYLAIDPSALSGITSATLLDEVVNQNIHGMESVDMLIITHPNFVGAAETLAQAHFEINGFRVGVVTTEQVYNEFSSGTPDVSAYRWAAKMFYDKAQNADDKIRYLLLFGKGSFDNRGLLSGMGSNLVLTYQSSNSLNSTSTYTTDDYFGLLDDEEGTKLESSDRLDIGIGRFPVTNSEDAYGVVNKTIAYMRNENNGSWKNQLCFIGDDGDDNKHMKQANELADVVFAKNTPSYHLNKILLDAYQQETNASGDNYPGAKNRFQNLLRSGLFLVSYMGHANTNGWANENIFTYNDAVSLRNKNLPLFIAGTCEFSYYDKDVVSTGEEVVRNSQGGGIGCFSAARVVYPDPNYNLMKSFCDALFSTKNKQHLSVGDAVMNAKNATTNTDSNNKLKYIYFGDPAVKMRLPNQYKISAKEINEAPIEGNDTLRALSVNTIKGIVTDDNGSINSEFNGTLHITILDKEETLLTLANDADSKAMEYKDRPNTIFRGATTVKNGEFEFSFMLPKDIKYNYGTGRMVFYAYTNDNLYEAQGHCEDFIVGGSNNEIENATNGPLVDMYLNHAGFVSGGKVNETPIFTAHVSDEYGINISSPTPGHDIVIMLDNKSYILNDYYEAEQDTYKAGTINYQFPELAEGHYTLMFRVWNLYNISSIKYLDFEVVKDLSPEIFSVICYPNPATTETNIIVNHDRENEIISMTVDVYDLSGRRIWSQTQDNSNLINWNLTTDNGLRVPEGMYIYRVSVKDGKKIKSSRANKIIVKN